MTNPLSFLFLKAILVLLFSKPSLTVFVSINCGSSEFFTDENNIIWTGDDAYIQHGQSQKVYLGSHPLSTLRVFPSSKKNCYSIKVPKGEKVLARASFYYGNYDNKFSPPIFDLQFDGNYWATVNTSSYYYVDYEAIYVTKRNFTSICVAQTKPNQLPFISSLEIRSLDPTMYSHVDSNHALILQWRYALGGNETIRYPNDIYDRIWTPAYGILLDEVKSEVSSIDISTTEDHPPKAAMQNAIVSSSTSEYIQFINRLPTKELPIYITTYFSEIMESAVGKRSIQMYIDNKPFSSPIVLPLGSVKEVYITNMTASANTTFVLQASETSSLPPILNAIEVYTINDALNAGTDSTDEDAPNSPIKQAPPPPPPQLSGDGPNSPIKQATPPPPIKQAPPPPPQLFAGDEPYSPIKKAPPPPQLLSGDEPNSPIKHAPPPPLLSSEDQPNSPIKKAPPPPPPQIFSGNELNSSPTLPELRSGDELVGAGSVKNNKLSILFIAAMQTLLPLLFMKFV